MSIIPPKNRPFSFFLILLFGLLCPKQILAQTEEIDSLKLEILTVTDTNYVNTMRILGEKFRRQNMDSALHYAHLGLKKAKEIGFESGELRILNMLAVTNGMLSRYPESLGHLAQAESLAIKLGDASALGTVYSTSGIVSKRIGDYSSAQRFYIQNMELMDSIGEYNNVASTLLNLGVLYDLMKEPQKALDAYAEARALYDEPDSLRFQQIILTNIAVLHYGQKKYKKALDAFEIAVKFEGLNKIKICNLLGNIASCQIELGLLEEAEPNVNLASKMAKEMSLGQQYVNSLHNLAKLKFRQGKLEEALAYSNENLEACQKLKSHHLFKEAHFMAHKIRRARKELKDAMYHQEQFMHYKDSLLNRAKVSEIKNLEVKHEVYKRDQVVKDQKQELVLLNISRDKESRQRGYWTTISILLLISLGLVYMAYSLKQKSNLELVDKNLLISEQKKQIEEMNAVLEKRMLRAQMNPHFIFNSLTSIQHFITTNDQVSALTYLTKFSKLLRQVLESSINVSVLLKEEIELLKIYVELESLRFDKSFSYYFEIDENLDVYSHEVPMLLVQPFVENAILHGLMPSTGNKTLTIKFEDNQDYVHCMITDNGVGREKAKELTPLDPNRKSRGMSVSRQRLQSLQNEDCTELLTIDDLYKDDMPSGTRVTIRIPKS